MLGSTMHTDGQYSTSFYLHKIIPITQGFRVWVVVLGYRLNRKQANREVSTPISIIN